MGKSNDSKKPMNKGLIAGIVAGGLVLVIVLIVVLSNMFKGGVAGSSDVTVGAAVDYEAEGLIKLGQYKDHEISVEVSEADIKEEIDYILEDAEIFEERQGVAANEDYVNIDYVCNLDGSEVEEWSASDEYMEVGAEDLFAEIDNGIIGMKTGETKDIEVNVPADYGDELIDGKKVTFSVTLNYICGASIKAELTDEFVQDYSEGECTSVDEFNDYIRDYLYNDNVDCLADDVWSLVTEQVTVNNYHKGELNNAIEEATLSYENFAAFSGYDTVAELLETFGMTEEDLEDVAKDMALDRMTAKTIAAKENLVLEYAEYRELLVDYMEYETGVDENMTIEEIEAEFEESYAENPKEAMFLEFVKRFVAENANVKGLQQ